MLTTGERRNIHIGGMRNQSALSGHTDGGSDVVSCAHSDSQMCRPQSVDSRRSSFFQFVFKDDEAQKL